MRIKYLNVKNPTMNLFLPQLIRLADISDGKKFNATVWFTKPFVEPPTNDTVDTYQENLQIKSKNLSSSDTHDLGQEANRVMAEINNPQTISNFTPLEKSVTKIDNNNAYKLSL